MTQAEQWIWLQLVMGEGAPVKTVLEYFTSPLDIMNSTESSLRMIPGLSSRQVKRILTTAPEAVQEIIYNCRSNGWNIIPYSSPEYPQRLRDIHNPPAVLYCDGELPDIDNTAAIGVVGTRKASEYAVMAAHVMARGITQSGGLVISGGALGIDTAAHKGALETGGKTIAVLGCGLGSGYLKANKSLRDVIRVNGALVTEFPPFTPAGKSTFPMRNRIISGLSVGVLVIEAGVKSGSLITANYALEQGRDVFAVPGSVISVDFAGTNKLIDDGAYVATSPKGLMSHYTQQFSGLDLGAVSSLESMLNSKNMPQPNIPDDEIKYNQKRYSFDHMELGRKETQLRNEALNELNADCRLVYNKLTDTYITTNELSVKCDMSMSKILVSLTQLEMLGLAVSAAGKRYKLA